MARANQPQCFRMRHRRKHGDALLESVTTDDLRRRYSADHVALTGQYYANGLGRETLLVEQTANRGQNRLRTSIEVQGAGVCDGENRILGHGPIRREALEIDRI